ncbi:hypothetical protein THAOC_01418 [Thalassiosira oceanica]|uniref:Uncharacterized protein n=1 Tax=Thalassiosira oceanica TaxID=159749 RepID=K0TN36_THAOC|nr:hypothetical protein THAOC_01418 [Thalassiosira oceanica]|eukprot:EJK76801.1 hypothetical protein THAOC_01418 [Thalassiosira oceanica]
MLVASFAPCTLDRKSVPKRDRAGKDPRSLLSRLSRCPTNVRQISRHRVTPTPSSTLAQTIYSSSGVISLPSLLLKWKKAKKNQRPRTTTRRQHSAFSSQCDKHKRWPPTNTSWPPSTAATGPSYHHGLTMPTPQGQRLKFHAEATPMDGGTDAVYQGLSIPHPTPKNSPPPTMMLDANNRREHNDADVDERNLNI